MDEKELEVLKRAHSCTIEEARRLLEVELKDYDKPVFVFSKWCKGCNICVDLCPKETLLLGPDLKAFQAKPEDCIACGICELHCPDLAIFVVKKKKEEEK